MNSGSQPNDDDMLRDGDDTSAPSKTVSHGERHPQTVSGESIQAINLPEHVGESSLSTTNSSAPNGPVTPAIDDPEGGMNAPGAPATASLSDRQSPPASLVIVGGVILIILGISSNLTWLTLIGALLTLVLAWGLLWPSLQTLLSALSPQQRSTLIAIPAFVIGLYGLMAATGVNAAIRTWGLTLRWDILGSFGDFLGAIGQIFVALLALFVAWRQYIISRDLTLQQNRITQQQTIDAYFQGISELVLDDEGLLEDWPQERIIAEARTAAILSSIDPPGKAKIIRFLSRSKLLTPLKRDEHLGRPILDGKGGYAEDRERGLRVINLGAILANADLSNTDLRWTDLSDVNLIRANISHCDLVRANFTRTILYQATLTNSDIMGVIFFCGSYKTASPRSRIAPPNFQTGEHTGAVVEDADFSNVKRMSEDQRQYCCRWGGEKTRATIPGGCEGIPNCLGR
jgi:uncharacterized protein YjbI with pentapeptide repeats